MGENTNKCLNCGHEISLNFCPNCGQKKYKRIVKNIYAMKFNIQYYILIKVFYTL